MIQSTKGKLIRDVLANKASKGFPSGIMKVARRKLTMLDAAGSLEDLRVPPANRLEALQGDRKGQHSIRVNDQWRFCFVWTEHGPAEVEFTDYH
ncbi:type II toxin-antitoxin system RelE/ParE family toxin [Fluviibacterium sp. DFM31]|uniref:Type II toxin-antitoxin system RelE/ParE family toxin n=1 Tax=Meridianimarinicoccus marinus TaxID=3231483 RepID=A0ABV3L8Z1_9RHOB